MLFRLEFDLTGLLPYQRGDIMENQFVFPLFPALLSVPFTNGLDVAKTTACFLVAGSRKRKRLHAILKS